MGREIVREQHRHEPGKRTRLWLPDDVHHVLTENTGTRNVEGIVVDMPKGTSTCLNAKSFMGMKNLMLLKIRNVDLSEDLEYLPNKLRYLEWHGCPLKNLPSDFQARKLLELNLHYSQINYLWTGIKAFEELKTIKLSHSCNLIETPDFTRVPNLEMLDLEGAEDCPLLEDLSSTLRGGTSPNFALHLFNCFKLLENHGQQNNLAVTLLKQYLQQPVNRTSLFHIALPGSEIPEWFSCRSTNGDSVAIGLPDNWLNDEFMGIAMCGVFAPDPEDLHIFFKCMLFEMSLMRNYYSSGLKIPDFTIVKSDHLWLAYVSRLKFEHDYASKITPNDTISDVSPVSGSTSIHARFGIPGVKFSKSTVIKFGIRLVYKQDLEDFQELPAAEGSTFHQNHNCSIPAESMVFRGRDDRGTVWRDLFMPTKLIHSNIRRDYCYESFSTRRPEHSDSDEEPDLAEKSRTSRRC
ncbi:hypothetical protein LWI28_000514 [Acer negundo]|uniref:C-JID domain-containing protein n=1 Tax=Acer negundo TaxID=4023 RepID=A0AAD5I902_ACENE|nr:hypothetical protein LWI28_000514 [Acer negundo]